MLFVVMISCLEKKGEREALREEGGIRKCGPGLGFGLACPRVAGNAMWHGEEMRLY